VVGLPGGTSARWSARTDRSELERVSHIFTPFKAIRLTLENVTCQPPITPINSRGYFSGEFPKLTGRVIWRARSPALLLQTRCLSAMSIRKVGPR